MRFAFIIYGLPWAIRMAALFFPKFRSKLKEHNLTVQMKLSDESIGRHFVITDGKIKSRNGIHALSLIHI